MSTTEHESKPLDIKNIPKPITERKARKLPRLSTIGLVTALVCTIAYYEYYSERESVQALDCPSASLDSYIKRVKVMQAKQDGINKRLKALTGKQPARQVRP